MPEEDQSHHESSIYICSETEANDVSIHISLQPTT